MQINLVASNKSSLATANYYDSSQAEEGPRYGETSGRVYGRATPGKGGRGRGCQSAKVEPGIQCTLDDVVWTPVICSTVLMISLAVVRPQDLVVTNR